MPGQKRRTKGKKTELKSGKQGNDPAFRFSVEDIANMHDSRNQKSRTANSSLYMAMLERLGVQAELRLRFSLS